MNRRLTMGVSLLGALLLAAGTFYLGRRTGQEATMSAAPPASAAADGRKVLYWHDPMVPGPRFDKPGKSPFMDMQLVPMYADSAGNEAGVRISPAVQQNLGIRYARVRRTESTSSFDAIGTVQFDERLSVAVQTRVASASSASALSASASLAAVSRSWRSPGATGSGMLTPTDTTSE